MQNWKQIPLAALLLVLVGLTNQTASADSGADWTAPWIGPAESTTNLWTSYRKTFALGNVPGKASARMAVDSKYWLWINGKLVVREGGLKRGPTPTGTYYDEIDLAPHLVKGANTVATVKGAIRLSLAQTATTFWMDLNSPRKTHARIALPQTAGHPITRLKVNGRKSEFRKQNVPRGVRFLNEDDRYVWFEVAPGTWRFEAEAP